MEHSEMQSFSNLIYDALFSPFGRSFRIHQHVVLFVPSVRIILEEALMIYSV
jgi:hypothetical protein